MDKKKTENVSGSSQKEMIECVEGSMHFHDEHCHGEDCGHARVKHQDHFDYIVEGRLHHQHEDHCDDHGVPIDKTKAA